MSYENVKWYFDEKGLGERVKNLTHVSGTVEQAAEAVGCEPKQIAKTMSFLLGDKPILIVTAGDAKVDNKKYKNTFHQKAKMIPQDEVESYTGHVPGGVCPFAIKPEVQVYLDVSLKRFDVVYPGGGNAHSAVELTVAEMEQYSGSVQWVDVCSGWMVNS